MTRYEMIKAALENLDSVSLVTIWNDFCDADNRYDDHIYSMDEFDAIMSNMSPFEIARAAYYSGKFCPAHNYFWFNGYGNLESNDFPAVDDSPIYISEIAQYIDDNSDALGNDEIEEVLDSYTEEE